MPVYYFIKAITQNIKLRNYLRILLNPK